MTAEPYTETPGPVSVAPTLPARVPTIGYGNGYSHSQSEVANQAPPVANLPALRLPTAPTTAPSGGHGDPVAVYLESLGSQDSRTTMAGSLDRLATMLTGRPTPASAIPWHQLRPDRTTHLRALVVDRYAPSTARKMLSALSGVLHQAWRLGLMTEPDYRRAIAWGKVRGSRPTGARAGRHVQTGELRALFEICAADRRPATGARDAAMLAVLYGSGLRRAEVVALDVGDYDPDTGALTVHGKGNKVRRTYCHAAGAIGAWLAVRGTDPGPLFLAVNKAGHVDPARKRLTTQSVYDMLRRRARAASVARFSPHDLRRSYAGELFDAGADPAAVRDLMGHATAAQTLDYDRRGEHAKARTAAMLHVPYVPPRRTGGSA